jgi:hypothetical protein
MRPPNQTCISEIFKRVNIPIAHRRSEALTNVVIVKFAVS